MLRIHFGVGDLARVRMVTGLGVIAESVFAIDLFGRPGSVFGRWRKRVRSRLGGRLEGIERTVREQLPLQDLLWLVERPEGGGGRGALPASSRHLAEAVFEFGNAAVVPYWEQGLAHLRAERDDRGRVVISGGMDRLLGSLHPSLYWDAPVLYVSTPGPDRDIHLDGQGLLLSPALFLAPRTCAFVDAEDSGPPVLAYSTAFTAATTPDDEDRDDAGGQALGNLVGHTRAAALQVLSDNCTTSELAERLGISIAGASKHATVLRKAGLIRTTRHRNAVLHTLTPLGVALLQRTVLVNRTSIPA
ncbi:ArsR/SmtB family transcription factor [Actinokineospora terrae]|uniref:Helix-turn-helix domain-containing protein n=1 Tax=Actinokineospora terrae TaxID=155974 RepID=A0A1H9XAL1_9PSEU|nr:winged helix-turn-helix domain-containing protein [Actinokineospora terrae]SES42673.1 Helix-turn-helix domain-containing protein [Actinokineospora terrae]